MGTDRRRLGEEEGGRGLVPCLPGAGGGERVLGRLLGRDAEGLRGPAQGGGVFAVEDELAQHGHPLLRLHLRGGRQLVAHPGAQQLKGLPPLPHTPNLHDVVHVDKCLGGIPTAGTFLVPEALQDGAATAHVMAKHIPTFLFLRGGGGEKGEVVLIFLATFPGIWGRKCPTTQEAHGR